MGDPGNDPPRPPFATLRTKLEAKLAELRRRSRARRPLPPFTDDAWRRIEKSFAPRLVTAEAERREAPVLLADLLARPEPDRLPVLAKDPRFASLALAQLLLAQKPPHP